MCNLQTHVCLRSLNRRRVINFYFYFQRRYVKPKRCLLMQTQLSYFVAIGITIVVIRTYLSTESVSILSLINAQPQKVNLVMKALSFANSPIFCEIVWASMSRMFNDVSIKSKLSFSEFIRDFETRSAVCCSNQEGGRKDGKFDFNIDVISACKLVQKECNRNTETEAR